MAKDRAFKVFLALPYDVIDNLAEMVDVLQTDDEITKAVSRYVMLHCYTQGGKTTGQKSTR